MIHILTNKHLIIALIVAPILAVLAYYAVDYHVSEKPHHAVEGQSYPLAASSNCRYKSGKCTFKNGDIHVTISVAENIHTAELDTAEPNTVHWILTANLPIQGAKIAIANDTHTPLPTSMQTSNPSQTHWHAQLPSTPHKNSQLHIALLINDSIYFGETSTVFTAFETGFSQGNMK